MEEQIILVDLADNEIGFDTKLNVHKNRKLHRAFSVYLMNGKKMLIQQRNCNKYHSGGLWANACCSHPRRGEKLEEAVHRRLIEELGISCSIKEMYSFVYYAKYNQLSEYEYDHVFIGEYSGEIRFDPNEIEQIKWIDIDELQKEIMDEPEKFSAWFIISCPEVIKRIKTQI